MGRRYNKDIKKEPPKYGVLTAKVPPSQFELVEKFAAKEGTRSRNAAIEALVTIGLWGLGYMDEERARKIMKRLDLPQLMEGWE